MGFTISKIILLFGSSADSFPTYQFDVDRPNITGREIYICSQHKTPVLLDFLNWTQGNTVQPDAFINHKSLAISAKNQTKNESPKYSKTNMKIIYNLDLFNDLIASSSLVVLMQWDWVPSLPHKTLVVLIVSLYKQYCPQSGNETLGGETINWGSRNYSLCSLMGQSAKKNSHSWGSCLLVPTKRVLTSLRLCGYMLYVKVYCTSGALCRICALPRCWPLFANGALLRTGGLVSPRRASRSAAGRGLHSLPT